jgi:hypothetical protein
VVFWRDLRIPGRNWQRQAPFRLMCWTRQLEDPESSIVVVAISVSMTVLHLCLPRAMSQLLGAGKTRNPAPPTIEAPIYLQRGAVSDAFNSASAVWSLLSIRPAAIGRSACLPPPLIPLERRYAPMKKVLSAVEESCPDLTSRQSVRG